MNNAGQNIPRCRPTSAPGAAPSGRPWRSRSPGLERGDLSGVSESILDALARALRLDDTEMAYLHELARSAGPTPPRGRRGESTSPIRPAVRRVLDSMAGVPAFLLNHRFDILAANPLSMALYAPMISSRAALPVNSMRFTFLDPHASAFFPEWEKVARPSVGALHIAAARHPYDTELMNLVGELSVHSDAFRTWWAAHDVYTHDHGTKRFRHPVVGELDLVFEGLALSGDDSLTMVTYSAEPGTSAGDSLELLGAWAATHSAEQADAA